MNPVAKRMLANAARESNPLLRESLTTRARRIMLREEITSCNACPLRDMSGIDHPFPFHGPTPALLAIVVDQPTKRDVRPSPRPATLCMTRTPAGDLLDRLLNGIGLTRDHCWIDAATHCPTHSTLGGNLLSPGTLSVAGRTKDDLSPSTCVERFAERGLRLSKAEVVLCMGERALLVAKQHRAFRPNATFEACRDVREPMLQAGRYWLCTWGIEQISDNASRLGEVLAAFNMASTLIEDRVMQRAMVEFPGSHVMPTKTYAECVDQTLEVLGAALKDLPPARARLAALDVMRDVAEGLELSKDHVQRLNARYAIRLLRDLEVGKIVWPKVGHEAKGNEE